MKRENLARIAEADSGAAQALAYYDELIAAGRKATIVAKQSEWLVYDVTEPRIGDLCTIRVSPQTLAWLKDCRP